MGDANALSVRDPSDPSKDRAKHITIIGDPSIRLHVLAPPTGPLAGGLLSVTGSGSSTVVSWTASADISGTAGTYGYYVYRSTSQNGPFTSPVSGLITGTAFPDTMAPSGQNFYLVRGAKLNTSGSGTYWNLTQPAYSF